MIRATYDTNTLASGTTISQGPISFVIDAWINDEVEMITSEPLINELTRTLSKPYFTTRLTLEQTQSFIKLVRERATIVPITTPIPNIATHPEDNIVLATAESGNASYIVTGDYGLQNLIEFKDVHIVNARNFNEILQKDKTGKRG
ncbi:putative toxin-antitoxin system toxin component, PIN family [Candidatus Gottesmanbacteria bacterium]|nr:putative toxin-antitoxin system toxin component, PIN family [Candidatus Gottesmanbacteria bacterium]